MKKLVVFTGAGVSADSGLATFRDSDGTWGNYRIEEVCIPEALDFNRRGVIRFYNERRAEMLKAEPNAAHRAIAGLERDFDVRVITQNVDNLHERAGSTHILHLHGELTKVTSSKDKLNPCYIKDYPLNIPIRIGDKAEDDSQLRPFIVWFGESVYAMDVAIDWTMEAEIFVVIGTSLTVYPAANLIEYVRSEAIKFIIDPTDLSDKLPNGFLHIQDCATSGVKKLVNELVYK